MVSVKRVFFLALFSVLLGCIEQKSSDVKAVFTVSGSTNPQRAAEILGLATPASATATTGRCARCHGEFKTLDGLSALYDSTWSAYQCFQGDTRTDEGRAASVRCLAKRNSELSSGDLDAIDNNSLPAIQKGIRGLKPSDLGFFTAAVTTDSFQSIFKGNDEIYESLLNDPWLRSAAMPKGGAALNSNDFQIALDWIMEDSPEKERFLTHDGPQVCATDADTFIGAKLKSHVERMSSEGEGWMAKNQANGLKMFGCDTAGCFKSKLNGKDVFPLVNNLLSGAGEVRKLYTLSNERSTFWTRSSADGRYVSYGSKPNSIIVDLSPVLTGKTARRIEVEADYDPAFTPDNLSFIYQGEAHGTRFCNQSMLAKTNLSVIDFNSEDCSSSDLKVGLYQGLGSSLDNGEIMTINGGFKSDEGSTLVQDSAPLFGDSANIEISRIRQSDSTVFEKRSVQKVSTPFIGNWMLSPSNKVAIGTVSGSTNQKARHGGFRLVLTDAITGSTLPQSYTDANTAQICVNAGEKPQASFDERFLVYYAYDKQTTKVDSDEGVANLYLIDLLGNGKPVKLTNLPKGSYAQFPHFRSDGWLYFNLYNGRTGERQVLATDAVLKAAQ